MQNTTTETPIKIEYVPSPRGEILYDYNPPNEPKSRDFNFFACIGWLIIVCGVIVLTAITVYFAVEGIRVPGFMLATGTFYAIGYLLMAAVFFGMGSIVRALWDIRDELRYGNSYPQ